MVLLKGTITRVQLVRNSSPTILSIKLLRTRVQGLGL